MGKPLIFIDGEHGTTGLQILDRLARRSDLELIRLAEGERKSTERRREALNAADAAILCLPDDAAREAVALVANERTRIIDASTAHRTAPGWTYGFPEMAKGQAAAIAASRRVSNPGCYPTGFIALLRPLVAAGLVPADHPVTVNAVSGYTGGGKAMIAAYEDESSSDHTHTAFRLYALGLEHKHTEEMRVHAGLARRPLFVPSVARTPQGMLVSVPLALWSLPARPRVADLEAALAEAYSGARRISLTIGEAAARAMAAHSLHSSMPQIEDMAGTDDMRLAVFGNDRAGEALLVASLDNLGKGAAGAAVQSLDLMLKP